jgi:hypothetical protein
MAFVIFGLPEARARFFPFFREKFAIKRVQSLAFEFGGDVVDRAGKNAASGFPAQISYSFVQSPAKIAASFAARSPLPVFFDQAARDRREFYDGSNLYSHISPRRR